MAVDCANILKNQRKWQENLEFRWVLNGHYCTLSVCNADCTQKIYLKICMIFVEFCITWNYLKPRREILLKNQRKWKKNTRFRWVFKSQFAIPYNRVAFCGPNLPSFTIDVFCFISSIYWLQSHSKYLNYVFQFNRWNETHRYIRAHLGCNAENGQTGWGPCRLCQDKQAQLQRIHRHIQG